jgi:hypothetical protein
VGNGGNGGHGAIHMGGLGGSRGLLFGTPGENG